MESHAINRIRRHLLLLDWLYLTMESRVINRMRRHLLLLDIFPIESHVINRIRRHLLSLTIFNHGKLCNKSDSKTPIAFGYIFPWKVV